MPVDLLRRYADHVIPAGNGRYGDGAVRVRSLGVTTLLFDDGETQLLFDANVTRPGIRRAYFGKMEPNRELVRGLAAQYGMQRLKAIFISHTHFDHVLDMPVFAGLTGAEVYGSRSTLNIARGNGVSEEKLRLFEAGGEYRVGNFTVRVIRSIHSPAHFYNNDLGVELDHPVTFPARISSMPEGGSYDFHVTVNGRTFMIRPSCNFIPDALKGFRADVFFYSIAQMSKLNAAQREECYRQTVGFVRPRLVIPVHWDDFFLPLSEAAKGMCVFDRPGEAMQYMIGRLRQDGIDFKILPAGRETAF